MEQEDTTVRSLSHGGNTGDFKRQAREEIYRLARTGETFTPFTIGQAIGSTDYNAISQVCRSAMSAGLLEKAGRRQEVVKEIDPEAWVSGAAVDNKQLFFAYRGSERLRPKEAK